MNEKDVICDKLAILKAKERIAEAYLAYYKLKREIKDDELTAYELVEQKKYKKEKEANEIMRNNLTNSSSSDRVQQESEGDK